MLLYIHGALVSDFPFCYLQLHLAEYLYRVSNGLENYDLKKGECGSLKALRHHSPIMKSVITTNKLTKL